MVIKKKIRGAAAKSAPAGELSESTSRAEPLNVLNAIAAEVSMTLDLSELLDLALERMMDLTGMEGGAVLLVDEETQSMPLAAARNLPERARDMISSEPLKVGEAIPGITAECCQLLVVGNSKDDERELPPFREMGVMTHVCIPLAVRARALGVLGRIDRRPYSFVVEELALFNAVGEQLGIAIERAQLFERREKLAQRLQTVNEVMRIAASSLKIADVFKGVDAQVKRLIDHDRLSVAVRLPDERHADMYVVADKGDGGLSFERGRRVSLDESPFGEVMRARQPIVRSNASEEGAYPSEIELANQDRYRSLLVVPLVSRGRAIGTLNLDSYQENKYSGQEVQIAQEIADHLAVVLEHTLLHEELEQTAETLQRLNKRLEEVSRHKSEFLANLSHELRTPLNAILGGGGGGAELLGEGLFGSLNDKQTEYIQDIHESGTYLLSLINDVLDLSKVEAGRLDLHVGHFRLRSLMESSARPTKGRPDVSPPGHRRMGAQIRADR